MLFGLVVAGIILCAVLAITANRLLASAIWLAGVSALSAILFYMLGAREVAVIELSIGVGLVTVLFVFAISIAGDEAMNAKPLVPRILGMVLVLSLVVLLGWMAVPGFRTADPTTELTSTDILWEVRGMDLIVQVSLIFAGVLSVLGLLSEKILPARAAEKGGRS
ncbi:MAG: NADH-quinone oxidoreductase subunit J [Anaerolineales bacterium]|nr:NADH-quinone oxidoreductase subunit J [Anaerolineales bacterium]